MKCERSKKSTGRATHETASEWQTAKPGHAIPPEEFCPPYYKPKQECRTLGRGENEEQLEHTFTFCVKCGYEGYYVNYGFGEVAVVR